MEEPEDKTLEKKYLKENENFVNRITLESIIDYNIPIEQKYVLLAIFNSKPIKDYKDLSLLKLLIIEIIDNTYHDRGISIESIDNNIWIYERILSDITKFFFDLNIEEIKEALFLGIRRVYFNLGYINNSYSISPDLIHEILFFYKNTYKNTVLKKYNFEKRRLTSPLPTNSKPSPEQIKKQTIEYKKAMIQDIQDYIDEKKQSHSIIDLKNQLHDMFVKYGLIEADYYKNYLLKDIVKKNKRESNTQSIDKIIDIRNVTKNDEISIAKRQCLKYYIEKWKTEKFQLTAFLKSTKEKQD